MKLTDALTLRMNFNDLQGEIRVDENEYICLNDLAAYYPNKRLDNWRKNQTTREFIETVDKYLNTSDSSELKSITTRRGKYTGGTYAHELIAMEFCTWLSPEFKMKVYLEYMHGKQKKKDWNIKRILAAYNYKIMSKSVEDAHDPVMGYHYGNEAKMINVIVFDKHEKGIRDNASEMKLDDIAWLEGKNSAYIDINMDYQERKSVLMKMYEEMDQKRFDKQSEICSENHKTSGGCDDDCFACDQHAIASGAAANNHRSCWLDSMTEAGLTQREAARWIEIFDDIGI